ncbi:exodeoxyribonuclease VII large subunit [Spiroplasma endosymbiont of Othius punctulatus]|uniref:exodeoxyribonuclease VII large subunit n=1 Tax=Spiroplasma endosymbiont of Othius punctulatus TaxID=3066289 RepID=UPI0030CD44B6
MLEQNVITVSELGLNLKSFVEESYLFKGLKIKGEISNLTIKNNSHIYFSLKDSKAKIDCAIWKSNVTKYVLDVLKDGTEIVANGSLSYYPPFNKLTLSVNNIIKEGEGTLNKLYDERSASYEKKGYFDDKIKKQIPKTPNSIGVITSDTGAAVEDIVSTIKKRFPIANIYLFPALVQGEEAKFDIAKQINEANKSNLNIDVLLVGRGGGSYEDLWAFNEEVVIEAIYNSKIPIISCIGHETDTTLSDSVSDLRVSTPTMAAVASSIDLDSFIENINYLKDQAEDSLINKLSNVKQQFSAMCREVELLSPYGPLNKGFSLIFDTADNKTIKNIKDLKQVKEIKIKMADGEVTLKIEEVK